MKIKGEVGAVKTDTLETNKIRNSFLKRLANVTNLCEMNKENSESTHKDTVRKEGNIITDPAEI